MKVLIQFSNQDKKPEVITHFINLENCQANDNELVVPGLIKINYSKVLECFCLNLDIAEKILSNICTIQIDSQGNNGLILFPKSLSNVILESKIINFQDVLNLASNGTVQYLNTEKKMLKAIVPLSQWLSADLTIENEKAFINLKFNDYEINVSDGSALLFCDRVKQHPLISAASLSNYFDFGSEIKIKPNIDYLCFWKILKSDNGYKKYSNFMNECKDKLNIIYDEGKKYRCEFDGGRVDFQLVSIGDKYPKKVVIQIDEIKDTEIIECLQKALGFKTIELLGKITNLRLTTSKLMNELKFYKDDNFFIFSNVKDNFKAEYDIGSGILIVKQEFHLADKIDKIKFEESIEKSKEWINFILQKTND